MSSKVLQAPGEQMRGDARQSAFQACGSKLTGNEKFAHDEEIPVISHDVQRARPRAQRSAGLDACTIISLDKRQQSLQIRSEPVIEGATVTATVSASAPAVLQEHYRILTAEAEALGAGQGLRALLSDHLDFTGSLAGHHLAATEGFLHGVAGVISTIRSLDVIHEVHDERVSAVLYDAAMPGGVVWCAEFCTVSDTVIDTLDLHCDGQDYLARGGQ